MAATLHNTFIRNIFNFVCIGMGLAAASAPGLAQVPANLLPAVGSTGEYVRPPTEDVKVVAVSQSGMTLECTQESADGLQPCTWRERYSVRDGRLVLDAVFTPHIVPPTPAHTEWQMTAAIGTANIGPATLDPRWNNYKSYLQYVIETVQSEWMRQVATDRIPAPTGSVITVKFLMNSKGEIVQILGAHDSGQAPASASVPCVRAINVCAPYGNWTEDMIAALGNEQVMSLSFAYQ
jgi:hypothetical protein